MNNTPVIIYINSHTKTFWLSLLKIRQLRLKIWEIVYPLTNLNYYGWQHILRSSHTHTWNVKLTTWLTAHRQQSQTKLITSMAVVKKRSKKFQPGIDPNINGIRKVLLNFQFNLPWHALAHTPLYQFAVLFTVWQMQETLTVTLCCQITNNLHWIIYKLVCI